MRILLAGYYHHLQHEEAWARALRELGHAVVEFRMAPYIRSLLGRVQNRFVFGPLLWFVNNDLLRLAADCEPDVIVCYRALLIYPQTVEKLKQRSKAVLVCYQNDNIFGPLKRKAYWRHFRKAIPHYDIHLVFRQSDIARYQRLGAKCVVLLRSSYLPWLHRRLPPEAIVGWESDIGFFGHCEPDARLEQMDTLMRRVPARYRLHGTPWHRYAKGRAWNGMDTHEIQGEDYVRAINGAKIALVFLSSLNEDTYTTRCFEIPACGTFMLSQRTDDLLTLYEENKEAVFFSSSEELVDKARYYLAHDRERQRIAEAGWRRCITSGYDIYSRMREWLAYVQGLMSHR